MPFDAEDLARTALVRLIPRGRYRIVPPNDARFAAFAGRCARVASRQQGAQPSFLLFMGPEQDPRPLASAAADWAAANWRANAVQKRVSPGVVAIQVGPAAQLVPAGSVPGTAVPAAVWTVDSETGRVAISGGVPGAPSGGEIKRAAGALAQGLPPPAVGQLDYAEREIMHARGVSMPTVLTGGLGILLILFALRYGFSAVFQVLLFMSFLGGSGGVSPLLALGGLAVNLLLVAGIALGVVLLLNFRGFAMKAPGFSSLRPPVRTATWISYGAAMALLALGSTYALPQVLRSQQHQAGGQIVHVTATAADDGLDSEVAAGGDLRVDLRAWPESEWAGVTFRTSNPSVLRAAALPAAGGPPIALFDALAEGTSRVDATSHDGQFTYQLRVSVVQP